MQEGEEMPRITENRALSALAGAYAYFTMPAVTLNHTFAAGSGQTVTPTDTLMMNDTGVSQGATLMLHLTNN
jgi:hypothetical protein